MGSRDNFLEKMSEYVMALDEGYIIGLSNKGIYNRALKDLEKEDNIQFEVLDDSIKLKLSDGTECTINTDMRNFKCSCPSRNICKHTVMSYLYLKQNTEKVFGEKSEDKSTLKVDFSKLLEYKLEKIRKLAGDTNYKNALNRIKYGSEVNIEEGSILKISFKREPVFVSFINENIEEAVCSCKGEDFCMHKAEALLQYFMYKGIKKETIISSMESIDKSAVKANRSVLLEVKGLIRDILYPGLSRFSENTLNRIEQMAVICHNAGFAELERDLRALCEEANLYLSKNAAFSKRSFMYRVQRIYTSAEVILNSKDEDTVRKFVGSFKTAYLSIPPIELTGLGAEAWKSDAGFAGITYYFYSETIKKLLSYTISRPTYYENSDIALAAMYREAPPWGLKCKSEEMCISEIDLFNGKLNDEGRLSSSKESSAEITGAADLEKLSSMTIFYDDFKKLLQHGDLHKEVILKIEKWEKGMFDNINQCFYQNVYDKNNKRIVVRVEYSNKTKRLIERLERCDRADRHPEFLLCRSYILKDKLAAAPITAYYLKGGAKNLTLD